MICCYLLLLSAPPVPHCTVLYFHKPSTTIAPTGAVARNRTADLLITNYKNMVFNGFDTFLISFTIPLLLRYSSL